MRIVGKVDPAAFDSSAGGGEDARRFPDVSGQAKEMVAAAEAVKQSVAENAAGPTDADPRISRR